MAAVDTRRMWWAIVVSLLLALSGCDGSTEPPAGQATSTADTAPTTTVPVPTTGVTATTVAAATASTAPESSTTSVPAPPPTVASYQPHPGEERPELKSAAAAIAQGLTTYESSESYRDVVASIVDDPGGELTQAARPLAFSGRWSRGRVIYPQLGGIPGDTASVMVVTDQTVGSGGSPEEGVVRTLDVRLVLEGDTWVFDRLPSAGGEARERPPDLASAAVRVVDHPGIELPDSARWDIYGGEISRLLLELMADLGDQTSFGVVVLSSGHPYHVFETDRVSHHSVGRAVDIYRFGDRLVVDDRGSSSETRRWVEWLLDQPEVRQVGSPWDLDGAASSRSFTDPAHQDHVHVAVEES